MIWLNGALSPCDTAWICSSLNVCAVAPRFGIILSRASSSFFPITVVFPSCVTFVELPESALAGGALVVCPFAACPAIPMAMIEATICQIILFCCLSIKFFALIFSE